MIQVNAGARVSPGNTVTKRYEMLQKWLKKTKMLRKREGRRRRKIFAGADETSENETDLAANWNQAAESGVCQTGVRSVSPGAEVEMPALLSDREIIEATKRRLRRSINAAHVDMKRGLNVLATIATTVSLVGLLGTAFGIIISTSRRKIIPSHVTYVKTPNGKLIY